MVTYKAKTKDYFSKNVRIKNFQVSDLMLRETSPSELTKTGKLYPKWEGPYKVQLIVRPGTYKLAQMDDSDIQNTISRTPNTGSTSANTTSDRKRDKPDAEEV